MSKLEKLRSSPARFFEDARHPWARAFGTHVASRIERSATAMSILEDPLDGLGAADLPILSALARRRLLHQARARALLLERAGRPTVSVVMAARNALCTIERAVESLLAQSHPVHEIVVVDDASEDGTADLVRKMSSRHPAVRLLARPVQGGAAMARNHGLSQTTGAYLTFQDADDVSHPERVERQLAALLEEDAVVCICNAGRETDAGDRIRVNGRRFARSVISMLFPREPVFRTVGYMRGLTIGEDGEYFERICAAFAERRIVHLRQTLYRARFSPTSLFFSNGTTSVAGHDVTFVHSSEAHRAFEHALVQVEEIRRGRRRPFVMLGDAG